MGRTASLLLIFQKPNQIFLLCELLLSFIKNTIFHFILQWNSCRRLPNTCTLKKGKQCKERMSLEEDHALPQLLHMQDRFFFQFFSRTATSQEHDCCSCPWKRPSLPCSLWKLGFHYCEGSWGLYWFWALAFQRNYYVNGQWPDILWGGTYLCACSGQ